VIAAEGNVTRLGIIGGGQLARMIALAARPLGINCVVLEPSDNPPVASVAEVIQAAYDDPTALAELVQRCDVVTVELEGIPRPALDWVANATGLRPNASSVAIVADRLLEKQMLRSLGIPTAPFDGEVLGAPAIVKTRRGGFDGRGNRLVKTQTELEIALREMPDPIVEGIVSFAREVSIVCARGANGSVAFWTVVENEHQHGILRRTTAPAPGLNANQQDEAERIARLVVEHLDYVGVLAVEMFETQRGDLIVNELAPRVHNSGHWSIEGATTSQFEQHVRAVCGLPLGDPTLREPTVMLNSIGRTPSRDVLSVPGAHLHTYEKTDRPARKVGHVTITAPTLEELDRRVEAASPHIPFEAI
jgi:5-(carboxyamino)imidazole ribonucleotide synthase